MGASFRVAIAGTGFIGRIHVRSARLAGAEVVGVSASSPERARAAAAELGISRAFESSEELVTARDVDVVHICTPNHLHLPLALAALAAGKHVVCEKPLALDAAGAEEMVRAAKAAGAMAAVPFVYRFYPVVRELRRRVQEGTTGAVRLVQGTYLQDWLLAPSDHNWRVEAGFGGRSRAFADIGSHWCDLVEFVTGHRITRVCADMVRLPRQAPPSHPSTEGGGGSQTFSPSAGRPSSEGRPEGRTAPVSSATEDIVTMVFATDRGARGCLAVSQVSPGRKNRLTFEISGQHESLAFDQEAPETAWVGRRDGERIVRREAAQLSAEAARYATLPGGHPQGYADAFDAFVRDAYSAMRTGDVLTTLPQFADGLRAARVVDAALRSAESRAWQPVVEEDVR